MPNRVGVLSLLALVLAGCGASDTASVGLPGSVPTAEPPSPPQPTAVASPAASPQPQASEAERAALLAQADRLAEELDGRAVRVDAVRTMSSTARTVTGWSSQQPDEEVWVLAISGDDYFCRTCSGPSDEGKSSHHLTLTVRAERPTEERLTFGMSLAPYDLAPFGAVQTLRG